MVQEFRDAVKAASDLASEVGHRFRQGDPAQDLVQSLAARLADVERRAVLAGRDLPPEFRGEIEQLLSQLQGVVRGGEDWLTHTDAEELASQNQRERVRRVYGVTAPDD